MEPSLSTGLASALGGLGQLQEVNGLWFNQRTIGLDGYRFIGCRFDTCTLHISTTNFELINCHLSSNTIITYGPNVLKVIKLFNSRSEAYEHLGAFVPERNSDNTISIRGI